jgi:hypothetical protein
MPPKPVGGWSSQPVDARAFRSLPTQNALDPAPVITATRSSGSAANKSKARDNSRCAGGCSAFSTSGRSIVTVRTGPSRATRQCWNCSMRRQRE